MTQVTTYPMQDDYESTLRQARDGTTTTLYVQDTPDFTMPASTATYVIVDPWTSKMQLRKMTAYNSTLRTLTVDTTVLYKWPGLAYTDQGHNIGAVVRISDNYQFRKDLVDAINTKVNTNSTNVEITTHANATARDTYFTSPVNWNQAYLVTEWYWTDYVAWSRVQRATSIIPNATTISMWWTEIPTGAEITAWTRTWWSWAILSVAPDDLAQVIQSQSYIYFGTATDGGTDAYVATLTPSLTTYTTGNLFIGAFAETNTTTTPTLNINWLWAMTIVWNDSNPLTAWDIVANRLYIFMKSISNLKFVIPIQARTDKLWIIEVSTDAEVATWTDTERAVTPASVKTITARKTGTTTKNAADASWTQNIAHWLSRTPRYIRIHATCEYYFALTTYNWTTQSSISYYYSNTNAATFTLNASPNASATQTGVVTCDGTNIIITRTKTNNPTGTYTLLREAR